MTLKETRSNPRRQIDDAPAPDEEWWLKGFGCMAASHPRAPMPSATTADGLRGRRKARAADKPGTPPRAG